MALPTATDLQDYLIGAQLVSDPPAGSELKLNFGLAIQAAIDGLAEDLGCLPLVSTGVDSTREFDIPDNGLLYLVGGGLTEVPTSVSVNGIQYASATAYRVLPRNAPVLNRPYQYLIFGPLSRIAAKEMLPLANAPLFFAPKLEVVGKWGFVASANLLPADMQLAILQYGALWLAAQTTAKPILAALRGDEAAVTEFGGVETEWSESTVGQGSVATRMASGGERTRTFADQATRWMREWRTSYQAVVKRYSLRPRHVSLKTSPRW